MINEQVQVPKLIRGSGAVELFDERTGRLYRREKFENYISVVGQAYQQWTVRGDYSRTSPVAAELNPPPGYPFSWIAVWDDNGAEDPSEIHPYGTIIGYASKTFYSGGSTYKGSPNIAECLQTPTSMKWVFDWPTAAANGTFQSVGWTSITEGNSPNTPAMYLTPGFWLTVPQFGTTSIGVSGTEPNGLTINPSTEQMYVAIFDGTNSVVRPISTAGVLGTTLFTVANRCIAYDPTGTPGFWMAVNNTATNPGIIKRDLTGTQISSIPVSWTTVFGVARLPNSLSYYNGYLYSVDSVFTPKVYRTDTTTGATTVIDLSTKLISLQAVGVDAEGLWTHSTSHPECTPYCDIDLTPGHFDLTGRTLGRWMNRTSTYWNSGTRRVGGAFVLPSSLGTHFSLYQNDPTTTIYLANADLRCIGTRALLASPVTKDVTKTMKITYTFTYV